MSESIPSMYECHESTCQSLDPTLRTDPSSVPLLTSARPPAQLRPLPDPSARQPSSSNAATAKPTANCPVAFRVPSLPRHLSFH
ncbi:hypothetical protein BCR44DRAFT_1424962 [Catenaria anguillulae PL171]|uniref:Uncharacterized protein n=1 Tax=Catenaria anguillulae PL171 TaxID=765915 RepID=A0A1Y2I377_9FUNG|nr:hypothetical protein BCR44DRAFT_1424962 [Catenaria anguillulae PL171]